MITKRQWIAFCTAVNTAVNTVSSEQKVFVKGNRVIKVVDNQSIHCEKLVFRHPQSFADREDVKPTELYRITTIESSPITLNDFIKGRNAKVHKVFEASRIASGVKSFEERNREWDVWLSQT